MKLGQENEKLEFKKTTAELSEGVISMAAILNKHGGGELYFGVRNDGTPLGMDISDKTLRDVSESVANHIEPKIYPKINAVYVGDAHCIHVEFTGDNAPYYAFGRPYIRVADTDRQMSAAELESYILKKNAWRDTWDSELSDKTVADVDENVLKQFLERANQAGRIDFGYTDRKGVLNKLEAVGGDVINNAACALFVGFALLEVQMAIFATKEKLTFLDIRRGSGNVRQLIETAVKYCIDNMRWRVVLDGSIERKEIPEIPIEAIREAITNSYCHRDYRSSQNNEIAIFSDRIEIYNPGHFPDGLTPDDFIRGDGRSVKRNPNIAQMMYYCKDIESFGTGLQRIVAACAEAGVKVEFKQLSLGFSVIFYRPKNHINIDEKNGAIKKGTSVQINDRINVQINVQLNAMEMQVLSLVSQNPNLTLDEVATHISKSSKTAQRHLDALRKKNVIRRVGSRKDGRWEIVGDTDVTDE
jgi:ATP-dependent DNA helicase RecG